MGDMTVKWEGDKEKKSLLLDQAHKKISRGTWRETMGREKTKCVRLVHDF